MFYDYVPQYKTLSKSCLSNAVMNKKNYHNSIQFNILLTSSLMYKITQYIYEIYILYT